jgi:predicted alpha/beta hydrolase
LSPQAFSSYAEVCGLTLARAHARSGFRVSISAYLGDSDEFDDAVAAFASCYADLNEQDHARLVDAIDSGRLSAQFEAVKSK